MGTPAAFWCVLNVVNPADANMEVKSMDAVVPIETNAAAIRMNAKSSKTKRVVAVATTVTCSIPVFVNKRPLKTGDLLAAVMGEGGIIGSE